MRRTQRAFELGEGPRWFHGRWYFVDILAGHLLTVDDGGADVAVQTVLAFDRPLGAVAALRDEEPGVWLAALGDGIALIEDGEVTWFDRPEQGGSVATRMNDGVCDPSGRFWAGSMGYEAEAGAGSLYRTDVDGTVSRVLDGLTIPNGPAFTAEGTTMYLVDSARGVISRYPVDLASGDLGTAERHVEVTDATPDGMVVDAEGHLWVAMWGGGRVDRFDPAGRPSGSLPVGSRQPTAPAFGGPSGQQLLVTTARVGLREPAPEDGVTWLLDVETTGPASHTAVFRR